MDSSLESEYEQSKYYLKTADHHEIHRLQRIRLLLLEHENDDLREEVAYHRLRNESLAGENEKIQDDLDVVTSRLERSRDESKKQAREIEGLRAEMHSLQHVSSDSTRLLTEKLALGREVASLKPEIENLRDQVAAQQGLLADKLSLQRQLNTLQVELDDEKRLAQKFTLRANEAKKADAKLDVQLERAQNELAKERKAKEKAENEFQRATRDLKSRVMTLESRSENLQEKLKVAKDQVKNRETELRLTKKDMGASKNHDLQGPQKRKSSLLDDDTMIGTPGNGAALKKGKKTGSSLGEKSTFSLTPYLNRGASVNPESPQSPVTSSRANMQARHVESSQTCERAGPLVSHQMHEQNSRKPLKARGKGAARLEQVIEEDRDLSDSENRHPSTTNAIISRSDLGKTKPRSLTGGLGKTLFDENDERPVIDRSAFGGSRRFGQTSALRKGPASVFGAISPLKKDKVGR